MKTSTYTVVDLALNSRRKRIIRAVLEELGPAASEVFQKEGVVYGFHSTSEDRALYEILCGHCLLRWVGHVSTFTASRWPDVVLCLVEYWHKAASQHCEHVERDAKMPYNFPGGENAYREASLLEGRERRERRAVRTIVADSAGEVASEA